MQRLRPLLFGLAGAAAWLYAQDAPAPTEEKPAPPAIRELSPGIFAIGEVKLNKASRTVQFPAALNMEESIVEYLLVTEGGKIHESVLRTSAEPAHIQLALLLLGAKGAGTNDFSDAKPEEIPGNTMDVEVSWDGPGGPRKLAAEQMVWDRRRQAPMGKGSWIYTGSRVWEGMFIAQQEGSIISLIIDPAAMINNPRSGAEDDESWLVNTNGLPPLNSPVEVTLRLSEPRHDEKTK